MPDQLHKHGCANSCAKKKEIKEEKAKKRLINLYLKVLENTNPQGKKTRK